MDFDKIIFGTILFLLILAGFYGFYATEEARKNGYITETFSPDGNTLKDIYDMDCLSLTYNFENCLSLTGGWEYPRERCISAYSPYIGARCGGNNNG